MALLNAGIDTDDYEDEENITMMFVQAIGSMTTLLRDENLE